MAPLVITLLFLTLVKSTFATGGTFQLKLNVPCPSQQCKTTVCVKNYQINIDNRNCYIGSSTLNSSAEVQLNYEFKFRWPGTFSLVVEQYSGEDELIVRYALQKWLDISKEWSGNASLSYRVVCLKNYYGNDCSRYCKARDDKFGHYYCTGEGGVECLGGWEGEYCERAVCSPACSPIHGSCTRPSTCLCHAGWTGPTCTDCKMYPGCKNGRCSKQWECECYEGWGGLFCNQDLNYCTNHRPCRNGGTCFNTGQGSYTCECTRGWGGVDCGEYVECGSSGNGTCPEVEVRTERGQSEEINLCNTAPCANGGSCTPTPLSYTCTCPPPFHGPDCSCPCLNGGSCVEHSSDIICLCPSSAVGKRCEQLLTNFTLGMIEQIISNEEELTNEHIIFIIMTSISIPFLILFSISVIIVMRRRRLVELERNAKLAQEQNEINTVNNINKLKDIYIGNNIYSKIKNYERNLDVVGTAETIATEHALNEGVEARGSRDKCINYSYQPDTLLASMLENFQSCPESSSSSSDLSKLATQV